jgi:hypothetical protein
MEEHEKAEKVTHEDGRDHSASKPTPEYGAPYLEVYGDLLPTKWVGYRDTAPSAPIYGRDVTDTQPLKSGNLTCGCVVCAAKTGECPACCMPEDQPHRVGCPKQPQYRGEG